MFRYSVVRIKAVFTELSVGFLKFEDRAQTSQTKQTKEGHEQFYCGLRAKNSNRPIKIGYFYLSLENSLSGIIVEQNIVPVLILHWILQ